MHKRFGSRSPIIGSRYDFILAIGDDTTDEDMFRALPVSAITVKVGIVSEKAKYNLSSQEEVLPFWKNCRVKVLVTERLPKA